MRAEWQQQHLPPYPEPLSRALRVTLFPLDLTTSHTLTPAQVAAKTGALRAAGSPLAEFVGLMLDATFRTIQQLQPPSDDDDGDGDGDNGKGEGSEPLALSLHDPICICTTPPPTKFYTT
jgi:hypothetical protein